MSKPRVIAYVDGYNFYHGLRAAGPKWKKYYWLDVVKFLEQMLGPEFELVKVNYFSARPLSDQRAIKNQDAFFAANKLNSKFNLILGRYLEKRIICRTCKSSIRSYEEKETDVRIATQLIHDVHKHNCDISLIVSADSDMIPSVELIRQMSPEHGVFVYFPPQRISAHLAQSCDLSRTLSHYKPRFNQSLLPEQVVLRNGTKIVRPANWM